MAKRFRLIKINEERHMVITPIARVSFPQVFVAKAFDDNPDDDKVFQLDLIYDSKEEFLKPYTGKKKQTPSMNRVVFNVKADQWGPDKAKWPRFNYPCFKRGDERSNEDGEIYKGYEGKFFITAKSGEKFPPKVIGPDGQPLTEADFYGGCYAIAQLIARPYAFGKNFGVRFILLQVMKTDDGEHFGGVAQDVFDTADREDDIDEENESDDDF